MVKVAYKIIFQIAVFFQNAGKDLLITQCLQSLLLGPQISQTQ
jgi:hypothetical protein